MFKFARASRKSDPCKLRRTLVNPVEYAINHTRYVSLACLLDPPYIPKQKEMRRGTQKVPQVAQKWHLL